MKPSIAASRAQGELRRGLDGSSYKSEFNPRTKRWRWQIAEEPGVPSPPQAKLPTKKTSKKTTKNASTKKGKSSTKREPKTPRLKRERSPQAPTPQPGPQRQPERPREKEVALPPKETKGRKGPGGQPKPLSTKELEGKKLAEGAYGAIYEVKGRPDVLLKKALDATTDLSFECAAMQRVHASRASWMPQCHELLSNQAYLMQKLDGPVMTCAELSANAKHLLDIGDHAYQLGIDVSDFHPFNYMWHKGSLTRIDAPVLETPVLFAAHLKSEVYRPLRLLARSFKFYPNEFETYLFTPACKERVPALRLRQLAVWYEFDPALALELVQTEQLLDTFYDEIKAAYKAAKITPQQAGKGSGPNDKVIKAFRGRINSERANFESIREVAILRQNEEFLQELQEVRRKYFTCKGLRTKIASVDEVLDACEKRLDFAEKRKWPQYESTGDVWRRNFSAAVARRPRDDALLLFTLAVYMTFGIGGGSHPVDLFVARGVPDDDKFVMEVRLDELSRSVMAARKMDKEALAELDEHFKQAGLRNWQAPLAEFFVLIQDNF